MDGAESSSLRGNLRGSDQRPSAQPPLAQGWRAREGDSCIEEHRQLAAPRSAASPGLARYIHRSRPQDSACWASFVSLAFARTTLRQDFASSLPSQKGNLFSPFVCSLSPRDCDLHTDITRAAVASPLGDHKACHDAGAKTQP